MRATGVHWRRDEQDWSRNPPVVFSDNIMMIKFSYALVDVNKYRITINFEREAFKVFELCNKLVEQ